MQAVKIYNGGSLEEWRDQRNDLVLWQPLTKMVNSTLSSPILQKVS